MKKRFNKKVVSIREYAEDLKNNYFRLDIIINNACLHI